MATEMITAQNIVLPMLPLSMQVPLSDRCLLTLYRKSNILYNIATWFLYETANFLHKEVLSHGGRDY